jgi:DMSO/TMAO reductase YedYZ molybdopterin-dependent catalytic subunit
MIASPHPGKSREMISLGDGLNYSAPLSLVTDTCVPTSLFFLRSNNPPPTVSALEWRLELTGRVKRPLTLDLPALRALPSTTQEIWMECAGNSRRRFDPEGEGNQWDDQAVSDARFTGVPLATVLEQAGVEHDAVEVVGTGYDADAQGTHFQRGLPLSVARDPSVLLAYAMNGEPLLQPHGGPVRLVVPRWAGIASVKWLARLELTTTPFRGYFNAERYIVVDASGRTVDTIREMPVKSIMTWPAEGEHLPTNVTHTVSGFAWSGHATIERVDVSTDDQRTWIPARLQSGDGPLAWTRWEYAWQPTGHGPAIIAVRAVDAAGNVQSNTAAWNKFGYQMNAIISRGVLLD